MHLCRTFQTAPAAVPKDDSAKYLDSGLTSEGFEAPDWLVPDLEDGTAPDMKREALENCLDRLPELAPSFPGEVWPRVQWNHEQERFRDRGREEIRTLVGEAGAYVDGIVVPKVGRLADVERAIETVAAAERDADLPPGSVGCALIIETAEAVSDLREIAALGRDGRLTALVFGPVDYTADLGGRDLEGRGPTWDTLLATLSNEASANDLLSIGGPFDDLFRQRAGVRFYNGDAYADQVTREARVGLDGSWSLYPKQTAQANRIHMPSYEELRRDVSRIEQFVEARAEGTGAVTLNGKMVDEATFRNFANTVRTVRAVHERYPEQTKARYDEDLLERTLAVGID